MPSTGLGSQAINKFATTELVGLLTVSVALDEGHSLSQKDPMQNKARLMRLRKKGLKLDFHARFQGLKLQNPMKLSYYCKQSKAQANLQGSTCRQKESRKESYM
jgi:hypothetical protein